MIKSEIGPFRYNTNFGPVALAPYGFLQGPLYAAAPKLATGTVSLPGVPFPLPAALGETQNVNYAWGNAKSQPARNDLETWGISQNVTAQLDQNWQLRALASYGESVAKFDDDVIIMAGYRIGPFEVESVMATHPAVAECAVIAMPDEVRGEVIEAYVVLRDEHVAGPDLEVEIQMWVKRNFAAHAYPRRVHFTTIMPKTPSGKIQRFVLKQWCTADLAQTKCDD